MEILSYDSYSTGIHKRGVNKKDYTASKRIYFLNSEEQNGMK